MAGAEGGQNVHFDISNQNPRMRVWHERFDGRPVWMLNLLQWKERGGASEALYRRFVGGLTHGEGAPLSAAGGRVVLWFPYSMTIAASQRCSPISVRTLLDHSTTRPPTALSGAPSPCVSPPTNRRYSASDAPP
eukprot:gene11192-3906_t